MKQIDSKISSMAKALDITFDENMKQRIPSKMIELNKLSMKIRSEFINTPRITVNSFPSNPPRKRRKLTAKSNTKKAKNRSESLHPVP